MHSRRLLCTGVLAATASLILAGCTTNVTGTPSAPTSGSSSTSNESLGDTRTLDPCSLVNPGNLASYGEIDARLNPDFAKKLNTTYEDCKVDVTAPATKPGTHDPNDNSSYVIDISFDNLITQGDRNNPDTKARTKQAGNIAYTTAKGDPNCIGSIFLPDQKWIRYEASVTTPRANVQTCSVVDDTIKSTLKLIQSNGLKHRTFPANVWGSVDYCSTLDNSAVSTVPQLNVNSKISYPGDHKCVWGNTLEQTESGPVGPMVYLRLELNHASADTVSPDDRALLTDLNGTKILLKSFKADTTNTPQTPPSCQATAWGRKIRDKSPAGGTGPVFFELDEITALEVYSDVPDKQRCDIAKALLGQVLAKLPPTN